MENRKRVLIVDDDPSIRGLIRMLLQRNDFEVAEAKDGAEAIERMSSQRFDAIVLDLMMPRASGYEVIEYAKGQSARQCIIVITALGQRATVELDRSQLAAVIHKPFDIYELVKTVRRCIEEQEGQPAAGR